MRWNDAAHVDRLTLLACRPVLGWCYAAVGVILAAISPILAALSSSALLGLMAIAAVLWFVAWYQVVGRLWRQPLVVALLVASVLWWQHSHGAA